MTARKKPVLVKERKHQQDLSASESNVESSEEERDKTPKAKKPSPVACKYRAYFFIIYHLTILFISVFFSFFIVLIVNQYSVAVTARRKKEKKMQKGSTVKCKYILCSVYQYCNVQLL